MPMPKAANSSTIHLRLDNAVLDWLRKASKRSGRTLRSEIEKRLEITKKREVI